MTHRATLIHLYLTDLHQNQAHYHDRVEGHAAREQVALLTKMTLAQNQLLSHIIYGME